MIFINPYLNASSTFDPDAQLFIDAVGTLSEPQKTAVNNLVLGLKSNGTWSKMYAIYPFIGGTADSHKWNLKDPRDLDVAFRLNFVNSWIHNSDGGEVNFTDSFANTFVDLNQLSANGLFSMGLYQGKVVMLSKSGDYDIAAVTGSNWNALRVNNTRFRTPNFFVSATLTSPLNSDRGYVAGSRISNSNLTITRKTEGDIFRSALNTERVTLRVPNIPVYLGAMNLNSRADNFSDTQFRYAFLGESLTISEMELDALTIENFQIALGR
jgi:hypothetical protein